MRSRLTFIALAIAVLLGSSQAVRTSERKTLSVAERVAYQYAVEEVYWRHRIWPRENPNPKPSLDVVISRAQIEKKVEDYLRNSELLADQWHRPITSEQLQAEMDRMATHSKQPDVLREMFAALGNDPFVIAECLARPVLAERLVSNVASGAQYSSFVAKSRNLAALLGGNSAGSLDFSQNGVGAKLADAAYKLPGISAPEGCIPPGDTWTATNTMTAPAARMRHTAIWTGSEMIVWGGVNSQNNYMNTGGKYSPATDSWSATNSTNAPTARQVHTAVWTGDEMIVWGGLDISPMFFTNTGGKYNPATDSWTATSIINAPSARTYHTAVWTGGEVIVWGGYDANDYLNTGGRYNPLTDSWGATSTIDVPTARSSHTAVWADSEMIVWGGDSSSGSLNTGGRYNPATDSWTATSIVNGPTGRSTHTAVWTDNEMIVWGGQGSGGSFNTGGRYDPSADSWIATDTSNAPTARGFHTAVWTGAEMIVWGGLGAGTTYLNTGGRYYPSTDNWLVTTTNNAPTARYLDTAIWTGNEMIVWGGNDAGNMSLNTGGQYGGQPIVQSAVSRKTHGAAGTFDVNLPLTGTPGIECRTGGATNDYIMVITFSGNVTVNGNPQAAVTSGIGTIGSEGIGNGGMVFVSENVVTVPLTNVANVQNIDVTLFSVNCGTDVVIPMSVLTGDVNGNGTVSASDVALTKSRIGQAVDQSNFRADVSAGGSINATDVSIVKANIGSGLP